MEGTKWNKEMIKGPLQRVEARFVIIHAQCHYFFPSASHYRSFLSFSAHKLSFPSPAETKTGPAFEYFKL
jgi:hypothetical protein